MISVSLARGSVQSAIDRLRFYQVDKKARVREVVATVGLLIESEAKRRAPVDTGRLRSSIHLELRSDGLGGEVVTNVTYAPHLEFGTRRTRAQPFLFPAAEQYRPYFETEIINALRTR